MSDTPLPLPIYPWEPSPERMQLIREAKGRINTPIKIAPVQASYGSPGRVLCFGGLPPFLCKSVPIAPANVDNVDSIEAALRAWLSPWSDLSRYDEAWWLSVVMGTDVRFSHEEDELGGVVFR